MDLSKFIQQNLTLKLEDLQNELFKHGIATKADDTRFICYTHDKKVLFKAPSMTYEANGAIFDAKTYQLLAIPPRNMIIGNHVDSRDIANNLSNYSLYYADDGMIVTLYYFPAQEKWCMSTRRGFFVDNLIWNGSREQITYRKAFNECLDTFGIDPEVFWKSLIPGYSYTFGFRHKAYHYFREGDSDETMTRLWFIQRADLSSCKIYTDASVMPNCGLTIPCQFQLEASLNGGIDSKSVSNRAFTVDDIIKHSQNTRENFLNHKIVCYGFILRTSRSDLPDIIFRSDLWNYLMKFHNSPRNLEYAYNQHMPVETVVLDELKKCKKHVKSYFCKFFPQYKKDLFGA